MQQDASADRLPDPDGWNILEDRSLAGFPTLVGPLLVRRGGDGFAYGLRIAPQHLNLRGAVHGGLFATLADHTLGLTVWETIRQPCATIQLNVQFVSSGKLGDFVEARGEVVRAARSVVFVRGELRVGPRTVATADGVWKVLGAP